MIIRIEILNKVPDMIDKMVELDKKIMGNLSEDQKQDRVMFLELLNELRSIHRPLDCNNGMQTLYENHIYSMIEALNYI